MVISDPRLDDNGKWEHYFSVALGGLLANPRVIYNSDYHPVFVEKAIKFAKEIADKAVTVKQEQIGSGNT